MPKTSASVLSGVPNTKKQMKSRGLRPRAFIVSRCLEPLMKRKARVFDMTSQSRLKIQCDKACKNNVFPVGMVQIAHASLCLYFESRLSHVSSVSLYLMVMAEKEKGRPSRFRLPKSGSEEQFLADEAVPSSTKYKNKWAFKMFWEWQQQREMKVPILDFGGLFKDYELHKVNPVSCEIEDMDAISLNYWLTKFLMVVTKDSG